MSDPSADHERSDPAMKEPGTDDQPGEFIDRPENQPGDQGTERLSDMVEPGGIDDDDRAEGDRDETG